MMFIRLNHRIGLVAILVILLAFLITLSTNATPVHLYRRETSSTNVATSGNNQDLPLTQQTTTIASVPLNTEVKQILKQLLNEYGIDFKTAVPVSGWNNAYENGTAVNASNVTYSPEMKTKKKESFLHGISEYLKSSPKKFKEALAKILSKVSKYLSKAANKLHPAQSSNSTDHYANNPTDPTPTTIDLYPNNPIDPTPTTIDLYPNPTDPTPTTNDLYPNNFTDPTPTTNDLYPNDTTDPTPST